ncbi:stefin-C-like [Rhinichthys klamathensis goyatoka]|uniref:stefin-C-like n=1 Tax=Rhinichthys klamathensis goyatoka TaxID=3034132 RepID=UPI0024B5E086|nr:stefin-C-like [Rhinichthys klamathensis goyatoka]
MSNLGGWRTEAPVTEEMKKICITVKPDIETAVGTNFPVYSPLSFRLQVVAGINYLVKVCVGEDVCVHAMIFQDFQRKLNVTGVQFPESNSEPLEPF